MADHKSSIISALVSQMKTGQISKNDLFEQLSTLQRPENITSYDDDDNDDDDDDDDDDDGDGDGDGDGGDVQGMCRACAGRGLG